MSTELPILPLSSLSEACSVLRESLGPLLDNQRDFSFSSSSQAEFLSQLEEYEKSADAQLIHQALEARLARSAVDQSSSWLSEWWTDSYLRSRSPLWAHSNVYICLKPLRLPEDVGPLEALFPSVPCRQLFSASLLVREMLLYRHLIDTQQLPRDAMANGTPLDMGQYALAFGTHRVPGHPSDSLLHTPLDRSRHLVCSVLGLQYSFVGYDAAGVVLSVAEIFVTLAAIHAHAHAAFQRGTGELPLFGLFTAMPRNQWSRCRARLLSSSPNNQRFMDVLERAAFFLCLDDAPGSPAELMALAYHGHGRQTANRCYDKSIQLIVSREGTAATNFDHTWVCHFFFFFLSLSLSLSLFNNFNPKGDGIVMANLADHVFESLQSRDLGIEQQDLVRHHGASPRPLAWQMLMWELDEASRAELLSARSVVMREVQQLRIDQVTLHVGKQQLKPISCHPDAFIQLAMQLAYFRTFGKLANVYESASTRRYRHGRTEIVRPLTSAAAAWLHAPGPDPASIRQVLDAHLQVLKRSSEGKGCDRYFFGVATAAAQLGLTAPKFLGHQVFHRFYQFDLSTSQNSPSSASGFGFKEATPLGFGIPYFIGNQHIYCSVASRRDNPATDRFLHHLCSCASELLACLQATVAKL